MKILFTGGGTGGHIYPIIAITREIKKIYNNQELIFHYIGPKDDFGSALLSKEGIKIKTIIAGKVRRYIGIKSFFHNIIDVLFKTPIGICQSFWHIFTLAPEIIFSKGGYGSIPAVFSGWFLRVPIFLHESDTAAGLANRILTKFSLEIFVSFPVQKTEFFPQEKLISIGNPIRIEILQGDKKEAQRMLKLSGTKPVILILGGSQGAQRINDKILQILPDFLREFEVIHQVGLKNFKGVQSEAKVVIPKGLENFYHVFPVLDEKTLKNAYAASDLIISRAGSGSIFEIAALGKPSILIPLPESAQNHQLKNAYCFAGTGASIVIEESNFTPHFFLEKLKHLFAQRHAMKEMAEKAKKFSKPKAANIIAEYIVEYLKQ
ncbi:UDP-N-acetylglucosamine--N-acetylmuramyl-(pentapeptide) pyrophosphoryl-undecaprenol N-acetylglucosamine transferase [Candidatus Parcubacteria bacterium]|nr:UDP-N-acetylglucosamine--N-acetylmuramyl-(pentapeptide) pyrophosphoryl-undecaprenol N-acetylglucosamine transferase [Candidatus Parcubacteria bacterium]